MRYFALMLAIVAATVLTGCQQQAGMADGTAEPMSPQPSPSRQATDPIDEIEIYPPQDDPVEPAPYEMEAFEPERFEPAEEPAVEPVTPAPEPTPTTRTVTVRKGDTLWSLATQYLGSGRRWKEIAELNPGVDANKLRIGQTLVIPAE